MLAQATEHAVKAAAEMQEKMNKKRDEFGKLSKKNYEDYKQESQNILNQLANPMPGMVMEMETDSAIVDGEYIQPGFEIIDSHCLNRPITTLECVM